MGPVRSLRPQTPLDVWLYLVETFFCLLVFYRSRSEILPVCQKRQGGHQAFLSPERTMHWSAGIWIFMKENCNYKYKCKYKYKENKVSPLCPETWEAVRVQTRKRTLVNKHNPTSSKQQANIFPIGGSAPASPTPRVSSFMDNILDRTQSLFLFVPQEKNTTVKLARLQ